MAGRWIVLGALGLVVLLAAGCGSTPTTRYYLLESPELTGSTPDSSPASLRVAVGAFDVLAPYDRDGVAYRKSWTSQVSTGTCIKRRCRG